MNTEPRIITQLQLLALRTLFAEHFKSRAWGLTHAVNGAAYYFPEADSCCCLARYSDIREIHVENAFKFRPLPYLKPAALAVTELLRARVATWVLNSAVLTCFEPVAKAWERQGWRESGRMPFDPALAPKAWVEELHGRPDVLTMRIAL